MIFLTQEIQVGVTLQIVPLTVFHYDGTVFLLPTVAWFPDSPLIKHQLSFGVIPYKLALLCLISSTDPPRSQVCKEKYNDTIDFQSSSHLNVIGSELRNKTFTILKLLELHVCVYTIYTCRYKFHAFFCLLQAFTSKHNISKLVYTEVFKNKSILCNLPFSLIFK